MALLLGHRLVLGIVVALPLATWVGTTYDYKRLFVSSYNLKPWLIFPSIAVAAAAGCWSPVACCCFYSMVWFWFFTRGVMGRPLSLDYLGFAAGLPFGSIIEYVPEALCLAIPFGMLTGYIRSNKLPPQADDTCGFGKADAEPGH